MRLGICGRHGKTVPWLDVNLPASWHLDAHRVTVPPMPREGKTRRDVIHCRRALLLLDLWNDFAFAPDSYAWDMSGSWKFDRLYATYLGEA
jgi:hypothetical protein